MENLSMGGDVAKELGLCFSSFAQEHENSLISTIAESEKPYSSGLHKTFCASLAGRCGPQKNNEL